MLDEFTLGIVAIAAGVLILAGWIPQIIQGYKTKKLEDVSRYLVIAIFSGAVLWLVYGIEIDDIYIIGVNIAAMFLTITSTGMIVNFLHNIVSSPSVPK